MPIWRGAVAPGIVIRARCSVSWRTPPSESRAGPSDGPYRRLGGDGAPDPSMQIAGSACVHFVAAIGPAVVVLCSIVHRTDSGIL